MISVRYLSLQILPSWYTRRIRSLHFLCSLPLLYPTNKAGKPSDFSVDTFFGEPPVLVTCLFDVTAVASTLKADTTDRD